MKRTCPKCKRPIWFEIKPDAGDYLICGNCITPLVLNDKLKPVLVKLDKLKEDDREIIEKARKYIARSAPS